MGEPGFAPSALAAAWTLQRPVKWIADRSEEFTASSHGRDQQAQAEMALDADGRILAIRLRTLAKRSTWRWYPLIRKPIRSAPSPRRP